MAPNNFTSQTTKNYYAKASYNVSNGFEMSNVSEEVIKRILLGLDTNNDARIDQIPGKISSEGWCRSIGFFSRDILERYNEFINKTINLLRRV